MRKPDRRKIAGEMQIDVFHRHDLRAPAARRPAFDAENRPQRRLAQGDDGVFADAIERVAKPDRGRGFALPGGRRRDGGDQHEVALLAAFLGGGGRGQFGFVAAV